MPKGNVSNHYVPRLILRKFSDKLCLYNVKTGELHESIVPEHAYAIDGLYDAEIERKLNEKNRISVRQFAIKCAFEG